MRHLFATALAGVALACVPAIARAAEPTNPVPAAFVRFAPATAAFATAEQIAIAHWGWSPCGGVVQVSWAALPEDENASSSWSNPTSAYGAPRSNTACAIVFNTLAPFDWEKLCTVVVHEFGHLTGHPHSETPGDVMSALYSDPDPQCATTPDPAGAAPSPAVAQPASMDAATPRRHHKATPKHRAAKRRHHHTASRRRRASDRR